MGRDSCFTRTAQIDGRLYFPDNCYTWAREKLKLAGIELVSENAIIITAPKTNTNPKALASKTAVYVAIEGIKFIKNPINITEYIHERLGGKQSWKVLSSLRDDKCTINGELFDNVIAKTTACLKRTFYNAILVDVGQLHIGVKVRNEGICYIDITKHIENYIYSCLKSDNITKDDLEGIPWDPDVDSKYDGVLHIEPYEDNWDFDWN